MLSGYSEPKSWNKLALAPLWLKDKFLYLIGREAENAKAGEKAHIVAKMNSLCDRDIIEALYKASAAGVKIELIVRGICCLKVGIPGVSENITVRSIVGNFWSMPVFIILKMQEVRRYICQVPTGCQEIWNAVWRSCSR